MRHSPNYRFLIRKNYRPYNLKLPSSQLTEDDKKFLKSILFSLTKPYNEAKSKQKKGKRKSFTKKTRDLKKKLENYRCEDCGKYNEDLELDHKNGDRSNNHITNCQLLCPNCHAKKTRKRKF